MQRNFKNSIFDALLIIFSVLFALLVTSSYDNYKTNAKKKLALQSIEEEFIQNKQILIDWKENHIKIRDKISSIAYGQNDSLQTALERFDFLNFGILTDNKPLVSALLSDTAWETAKSTGIIGEFDYETAKVLTNTYEMQNLIGDVTLKNILSYYYSSEAHQIEKLKKTMIQFSLRMYELTGQEMTLLTLYDEALAHLSSI